MSYPVFATYFLIGLGFTILLALVRLASFRIPWLIILAPAALGWIAATWPWVLGFFYLLRVPPYGLENISLLLFISVLAALIIRAIRKAPPDSRPFASFAGKKFP